MAGLRLEKNKKYQMLVVATAPKKQLQRRGKQFPEWIHNVHLRDKDGGNYYCETWTAEQHQNVFIEGEVACFYLEFDGPNVDEIVALDCIDELPAPAKPKFTDLPKEEQERLMKLLENQPWQQMAITDLIAFGQMDQYLISMLIAKDIFVAQVISGKLEGSGPDLSYLFMNADHIYKQLSEKMKEQEAPI